MGKRERERERKKETKIKVSVVVTKCRLFPLRFFFSFLFVWFPFMHDFRRHLKLMFERLGKYIDLLLRSHVE